ncbi:hypothetical protein FPV67DRAFT_253403 [Lyophyllum atratum]|nr:hypothetical protein FPV67DRAFT_253403 [Lyophyllum atratum]
MSEAPSMRKRTTSGSSTATANNLPPPRTSKPMKPVSAPLTHTRLNRLIYLLVILTTLLAAYYSYRALQYKTEVGGWWNLALGRRPPQMQTPHTQGNGEGFSKGKGRSRMGKGKEESVEDRINALARALGMPPKELASAIAVAVRQYVPPASLSSVAAKESGPAVKAMLSGEGYDHVKVEKVAEEASNGVVGGIVSGMEGFVGMDEP